MNHLFVELFSNYTRILDLHGETIVQDLFLSQESFNELKEFIKEFDEWNINEPTLAIARIKMEVKLLYPDIDSDTPFLQIDGYTFKIKINQE